MNVDELKASIEEGTFLIVGYGEAYSTEILPGKTLLLGVMRSRCASSEYKAGRMKISEETIGILNQKFGLEISVGNAFTLLGALQLALRNPQFPQTESGKFVEGFARDLQGIISANGQLAFMAEAGWNEDFHMETSDEPQIIAPEGFKR